ncbi:CsgE family curli-type amyloid fiber assembly protein [Pontibacter actiniarum]|nr:CsgE family curli-type amyloid fiber assembly protein [Pontibacter actiniarum]
MWRMLGVTVLILAVLLLPQEVSAQESQGEGGAKQDTVRQDTGTSQKAYEQLNQFEQPVRSSADLEVDGLIVDETITKIGRDFYDVFHRQWEAPPTARNFTILIKERPTRGNGALVQVALNDQLLFEQQLQPRYDVIEEVATYVAAALYEHLLRDQLNQQLEAEGRKAREVF